MNVVDFVEFNGVRDVVYYSAIDYIPRYFALLRMLN